MCSENSIFNVMARFFKLFSNVAKAFACSELSLVSLDVVTWIYLRFRHFLTASSQNFTKFINWNESIKMEALRSRIICSWMYHSPDNTLECMVRPTKFLWHYRPCICRKSLRNCSPLNFLWCVVCRRFDPWIFEIYTVPWFVPLVSCTLWVCPGSELFLLHLLQLNKRIATIFKGTNNNLSLQKNSLLQTFNSSSMPDWYNFNASNIRPFVSSLTAFCNNSTALIVSWK